MIDSYEFGRIVINGKRYDSDLIVFSDKVRSGWWRKEGHRLHVEDLKDVLEVKPEVLVVGTGYSGLMTVPPETRRYVESEGIELMAQKTTEACETFNRLVKSRKVVAALHLTC
ncbi:Mth938-like domain-containing protein [Candidatus Bathyarchaeota archaeon]|nr:Mth938-like domain-containing protein [Candidatus Bathyarchaeota archaeon]